MNSGGTLNRHSSDVTLLEKRLFSYKKKKHFLPLRVGLGVRWSLSGILYRWGRALKTGQYLTVDYIAPIVLAGCTRFVWDGQLVIDRRVITTYDVLLRQPLRPSQNTPFVFVIIVFRIEPTYRATRKHASLFVRRLNGKYNLHCTNGIRLIVERNGRGP